MTTELKQFVVQQLDHFSIGIDIEECEYIDNATKALFGDGDEENETYPLTSVHEMFNNIASELDPVYIDLFKEAVEHWEVYWCEVRGFEPV